MSPARLVYAGRIGGLAVAYFVLARIGLTFDAVSGFATLIWPPTGISLAALLIFGPALWPGVFLGAFFANLSVGVAPLFLQKERGDDCKSHTTSKSIHVRILSDRT